MWSPTPTVAPGPSYPAARKPGFFQRLSIGWKLTKVSLGVLRKEKGLVLLPFVPVLIFEKIGPWAAVKRSGSLLRQTWGEAAGGYLTLGGIFVLLALPALLVILLGLVGSAAQSILVTALYRYATTGELGFGLPRDLVAPPTAR